MGAAARSTVGAGTRRDASAKLVPRTRQCCCGRVPAVSAKGFMVFLSIGWTQEASAGAGWAQSVIHPCASWSGGSSGPGSVLTLNMESLDIESLAIPSLAMPSFSWRPWTWSRVPSSPPSSCCSFFIPSLAMGLSSWRPSTYGIFGHRVLVHRIFRHVIGSKARHRRQQSELAIRVVVEAISFGFFQLSVVFKR